MQVISQRHEPPTRARISRLRLLAVAAVLLGALVLAGCDSLLTKTLPYIAWTEQQRDEAGAPRARWDQQLANCADEWAGHLLANDGAIVHGDVLLCMPPGATKAGENISVGPNPFSALQAIVSSPSHVTNMNSHTWTRFGVGVATGNGKVMLVWRFSN